jgi:sigma-B regulation protein RsbU (phosphoserine phosphatase)
MLVVVIDTDRNIIELATAGHQPPLIGTGGAFESMRVTPQLVLGVDDDVTFPTERFDLSPQSALLLYTDGAVDVQSPGGERFSTERQVSSLYGRFGSAAALLDAALDAVNEFRGGRDLGDDLTFVAIQLQSTPVETSEIAAAG